MKEPALHEYVDRLGRGLVAVGSELDDDFEADFEARLVESSTLAFRVAFSVLRHRQDAEDVAQEAFVKAYRRFRQLRDRTRFRAWLVRMTWRLAIDRQRADRRRVSRELRADPPASATPHASASRERIELVWQAIDRLPEKLRIVVVLSSIEGHDVGEVAALLGLPQGTVKSRLFFARRRMKEILQ